MVTDRGTGPPFQRRQQRPLREPGWRCRAVSACSDNDGPPYFILDAYIPPRPGVEGQIVSRKNSQLASVQEATAIGYIGEFRRKYSPGETIASTNSVPTNLRGGTLQGQQYLEVPVQNQPIPQAVLDFANAQEPRVIIRDVAGREYN